MRNCIFALSLFDYVRPWIGKMGRDMHFSKADIPNQLIKATYSGSLVVFAGAGVSMQDPVCLPSFNNLVLRIKEQVDPSGRQRQRHQKELSASEVVYTETPEQYLSFLESTAGNVRQACCSVISQDGKTSDLHKNLLRLFAKHGSVKIVTTNFDDCFEVALRETKLDFDLYSAPALPYGDTFCGLAHLHGLAKRPESMVLLAEDYGKAYVTSGWATRFLVELFEKHTVLFIGYSCSDSLVDYLTRSISSQINGKAYALCRKNEDVSNWCIRGVTPILFDEYDDLPAVIGDWATYLEQSVTDRVNELEIIASRTELGESEKEYVLDSLRWHDDDDRALFTRVFCSASSSFGHLEFLKENGHTAFLTNEVTSNADWELLQWTVSSFSINNCAELQQLCASIRDELSFNFFDCLIRFFLASDVPDKAVGPWIAWLECMPLRYSSRCAYGLSELAAKCLEPEVCFSIIRILLRVDFSVANDAFLGIRQEPVVAISDKYYEDDILKGLKKHRAVIGKRVFEYCFQQIELAYSIQTSCWTNLNVFDCISFSRSSVEPHPQDRYSDGAGSILLDVIRESVDPAFVECAIERCLDSKCAILVRLGLWLKSEYRCSGEALALVQEKNYLANIQLHHEVFQLIRKSFVLASDEQKRDFANYLRHHFKMEEGSDYECFNICGWILERTPCNEVVELKNEILARNPNFRPREHPDFTHYVTSSFIDNTAECKVTKSSFNINEMI